MARFTELILAILYPDYGRPTSKQNREAEKILKDQMLKARKLMDADNMSDKKHRTWVSSVTSQFWDRVPDLRFMLEKDVQAAIEGDPAAKSVEEVILTYPGLEAISIYRVAHLLYQYRAPILPRMMTELAHRRTGIDIHPGAIIGDRFFIDHGTGVVIGETTEIGNNVKLYQGVTLGALSISKDDRGKMIREGKRHPTIEDDVVIYSGATILGGKTVIGRGSVIGGNTWITHSIPRYSRVINEPNEQKIERVRETKS